MPKDEIKWAGRSENRTGWRGIYPSGRTEMITEDRAAVLPKVPSYEELATDYGLD